VPLGQYDDTRLVNVGNNRCSLKPEIGFSKAIGRWPVEFASAVTFYTDNTDFFAAGGANRHCSTPRGLWDQGRIGTAARAP